MLEFQNVTVEINKKQILKNVYERAEPGRMLGLMGPSGAGKSTLLKILACEIGPEIATTGQVFYNGAERPKDFFHLTSFLEQEEFYVGFYTVYEYLQFACIHKNFKNSGISDENETNITNNIEIGYYLEKLHLKEAKNTKIENLSGGQRKRFFIALEFLSKKPILFLDEPTSGLDSHLALEVVLLLKKVTLEENRTVIMTLHQPGQSLINVIDDLLFLYDGKTFYSGPMNHLKKFLDEQNLTYENNLPLIEHLFLLGAKQNLLLSTDDTKKMDEKMKIYRNYISKISLCNDETTKFKKNEYSTASNIAFNYIFGFKTIPYLLKRQVKLWTINKKYFLIYLLTTAILLSFTFISTCLKGVLFVRITNSQRGKDLDIIYFLLPFFHILLLVQASVLAGFTMENHKIFRNEIKKSFYTFFEFMFASLIFQCLLTFTSLILCSFILEKSIRVLFLSIFISSQLFQIFQSLILLGFTQNTMVVLFMNLLILCVRFVVFIDLKSTNSVVRCIFFIYKMISYLFPISYISLFSFDFISKKVFNYFDELASQNRNDIFMIININLMKDYIQNRFKNIFDVLKDFRMSVKQYYFSFPFVFFLLCLFSFLQYRKYYGIQIRTKLSKN